MDEPAKVPLQRKYDLLLTKYNALLQTHAKLSENERQLQKEVDFFRAHLPILRDFVTDIVNNDLLKYYETKKFEKN